MKSTALKSKFVVRPFLCAALVLLSQLGTKYLNQIFIITREVKNHATGVVSVPANYGELGMLLITVTIIGLTLPVTAILLARACRLSSA